MYIKKISTDGWVGEWMEKLMSVLMGQWMDGWMDEKTAQLFDCYFNGLLDE